MSFYDPEGWSYIRVRGMGLVDALACPHYDSATAGIERRDDFQQMMRKHSGMGLAIDDLLRPRNRQRHLPRNHLTRRRRRLQTNQAPRQPRRSPHPPTHRVSLALDDMKADGYRESITLWTVNGYERGIAFYEAMGWRRDGGTRDAGRQIRFRHDLADIGTRF